jgi:hypothetical protein
MSWLRKGRETEGFEREDADDRREPLYVPASQRPRPMPAVVLGEPTDGAPDEQVELLASLVQEIDKEQTAAVPAAAASTRFSRRTMDMEIEDELWAFHETTIAVDQHEGLRKYTEHEVEMDELIDDLALTMAALRLRRAA